MAAVRLVLAVLALLFALGICSSEAAEGDAGSWKVGDCVLLEFAMEFDIHPNAKNKNATSKIDVLPRAKAVDDKKYCGNETQTLILKWTEEAQNDTTVVLNRNLTISFQKATNESSYGVERIYAYFELAKFKEQVENNTVEHTSFIAVDSGKIEKLLFSTPLDRSFVCADAGPLSFQTYLQYDYENWPPGGVKLVNTTMDATKVRFDAFRDQGGRAPPPGYRTPLDCDYKPNDVVPIAVGVALALLVVCILIAYMYGRRRNRLRGYESV